MSVSSLATVQKLLAGMVDAALVLDHKLCPVDYNEAFVMLLGQRRRVLRERLAACASAFDLLPSPEPLATHARGCLANGRAMRLNDVTLTLEPSRVVIAIVSLVPIASASGEPEGLALILRDVSAEVRLQERFKALLCSERARADELEQRVGERTRDLTAALAEVTRLSRTDPLTGLLNRRAMADRIRRAIALGPPRPELGVGLLMTDLDHFKRINDTFGHEAGDTVLVAVANILVDVAGESDAVARFGGEEFVLLLQDATLESLRQTGERCNAAVRTLALGTLIDHANGALTISVGAAIFPTHAGSFEEILLKADRALYAAKGRGRDRTVVWSDLEHASAR